MARYSTRFGSAMAVLVLAAAALGIHGLLAVHRAGPTLACVSSLVRALRLTDLCLFTEASYTRHLSMADLNTPFQDSPLTFEHFPSGSLASAPRHLFGYAATRMTVTQHGR